MTTLLRVTIDHDHNAEGQLKWLVTPRYRHQGRILTVPDDRGWDSREDAENERRRLQQPPETTR